MSWSYHKRIKIIPGVHLNFSKSGISTSIGIKGVSVNFGKSGAYLNTHVPLLGIHNRQKLSGGTPSPITAYDEPPIPPATGGNIFSADIHEITSQNMQGIKEAMLMARQQRHDLNEDLEDIQRSMVRSKLKLNFSYWLLYGFINRSIPNKIKSDIKAQENAILQIKEQIARSYVALDVRFDPGIREQYDQVISTFRQLMVSHKIWDVTSAHYQDRVAARSSASTVVSKREVKFGIKELPEIQSPLDVLYFQNANGADLYFYPGFIIMYASKDDFALIGIDEIIFNYSGVRFTETGPVPRDSKIIDRTWAKVNKNGTPDKRFNGNYQIPVVRYGELSLKTNTGLHEEYECSNYEATQAFGNAFSIYQECIRLLNRNGQ